ISTFISRYNGYTTTVMNKPFGGVGYAGGDYMWGIFSNEIDWALATQQDGNPMASTCLNDALVTRWQNDFLPYAAAKANGGVAPEGAGEYGRYMLGYPVPSLMSEGSLGN